MFDFGFGDEDGMVTVWQRFLIRDGFDVGSAGADGIFGTDSKLATSQFQVSQNLGSTGHVDRKTWEAAVSKDNKLKIPKTFGSALVDWYRILPLMRRHTLWGSQSAKRKHWIVMYDRVLAAFSESKDREQAILKMREYYSQLVRYSIGEEVGNPQSGSTIVHPIFKQRLERSITLASSQSKINQALSTVTSQGGFNIRKITGGSSLSNHSFGTAIDLSASRNPFVYKGSASQKSADFPLDEFRFLTGVDPFDAEMVGLLSKSRKMHFADVLPIISKHRRASDNFALSFSTRVNLVEAFIAAADRTGLPKITGSDARALLGLSNQSDLVKTKNQLGNADGWESLKRVGRELNALFLAKERADDSQVSTKDPGYIAKWGWVNLDEVLISALICKEGGGLRWIGAGNTRKDAMHFELHKEDAEALRFPLVS